MDKEMQNSERDLTLLDYWRVIWRRRWIIIGLFFISVISTMFVGLKSPKIYESTASVLPPEMGESSARRLSVPGFIAERIPSLSGGPTPTNIIVAMLKSKRMAEDIVRRFNLKEFYNVDYLADAIRAIQEATKIEVSKESLISVTVESPDPKLAADIANFYVENLDVMNEELKISTTKPIVRILDIAKPAPRKSKPRIRTNMMVSGVISLFVAIFIVFLLELNFGKFAL